MSDIDKMIDRLTPRQRDEFTLKCARRVQRLMIDPRSMAALDTRERWLRGEASDEEMSAAAVAARAAAQNASLRWDEVAAALVAVRAAEGDAERAARDALWTAVPHSAERAWQRDELERMLKEGGGA